MYNVNSVNLDTAQGVATYDVVHGHAITAWTGLSCGKGQKCACMRLKVVANGFADLLGDIDKIKDAVFPTTNEQAVHWSRGDCKDHVSSDITH